MADLPPIPSARAAWVDGEGRPTGAFLAFINKMQPFLELASTAIQDLPDPDPDTLYRNVTATLTAGYTATPHDAGTKSSGTFTPLPADGNLQRYVNGGAHTLGKPTSDCSIVVLITNNASAGAINTSAFTKVRGGFTTANGAQFFANIVVINGVGLLSII